MASPWFGWSKPGQGIRTPPGGGQNFNIGQRTPGGLGAGGGGSNYLDAFVRDKGNLLNRLSAHERNFVEHDLGLRGLDLGRYQTDTGRSNILDQLRSQETIARLQDATNRFGVQADYDASTFGSLANLAGNRYGSDRAAQAQLGSAAIGAQSNMLAPMLQQQRFMSLAPHVLGALGSLGQGGSNLSQALMGGQ